MIVLPTYIKIFGARILYHLARLSLFFQGKKGDIHIVRRDSITYELELNEGIDLSIFIFGAFEKETSQLLKKHILKGDFVLDIGANVGAHTLTMAEAVGDNGLVIALEATDWAFNKLQKNISLNPSLIDRIAAIQCLLSADDVMETPTELYSSWDLNSSDGQHAVHKGILKSTADARTVSLDTLLSELNLSKVDFIKIDVDGFEYWVLKGAEQTLKKFRPKILIELSPYVHLEHGSSFETLMNFLSKIGYSFYSVHDERPLPQDIEQLKKIIPAKGGINAIARMNKKVD